MIIYAKLQKNNFEKKNKISCSAFNSHFWLRRAELRLSLRLCGDGVVGGASSWIRSENNLNSCMLGGQHTRLNSIRSNDTRKWKGNRFCNAWAAASAWELNLPNCREYRSYRSSDYSVRVVRKALALTGVCICSSSSDHLLQISLSCKRSLLYYM